MKNRLVSCKFAICPADFLSSIQRSKKVEVKSKARGGRQEVIERKIKPAKPWEMEGLDEEEQEHIQKIYSPLFKTYKEMCAQVHTAYGEKDVVSYIKILCMFPTGVIAAMWEAKSIVQKKIRDRLSMFEINVKGKEVEEKIKIISEKVTLKLKDNNTPEHQKLRKAILSLRLTAS